MFKLLITFRKAYETRNFSKAAEILFISQPAVSNQIKQLEEELGCTLFRRKGKQEMAPTESADILYQRLLNLTDDWQETVKLVNTNQQEKKLCKISASNTFSIYYLPELIKQLMTLFPEIIFELDMKNSEEVLESLEKHQIDFGFIEKPIVTDGVSRTKIEKDELVIAGNLSSDLWLSREATSGVFHYMENYLLVENIKPEYFYVKNNEMIIKLLEEGIGKSLISKRAVTKKLAFETLGTGYFRYFYFLKQNDLIDEELEQVAKAIELFYENKSK
ncbi:MULTISPECIES: LysR family transcriptional regulator [Vagococcus]|uniref:LysR family transcriptional regulator YeiE n=1 Tax=Vagococcus fluvialis bH819 TaxID=1255619 RepID=A0A1X6WSA5_9ENTE|nr:MULTISPECIES: LysR family transcriptional regulator [Vagococcus]SLM87147.1 LysR family transcriptional regulator YeiE [Vagococcus fluvialis bH819]HCM90040.1 LysR family transcriptional regulator [Vagococcus sp.]